MLKLSPCDSGNKPHLDLTIEVVVFSTLAIRKGRKKNQLHDFIRAKLQTITVSIHVIETLASIGLLLITIFLAEILWLCSQVKMPSSLNERV